jgi:hypothetical protein
MVLTVSFTLSSVTGLFCHRRFLDLGVSAVRADIASTKLDASVGAPGPHDFAVRAPVFASFAGLEVRQSFSEDGNNAARLATLPRPPHPAQRS